MGQIQGSVQNIEVDFTGAGSSYKTLVCLRSSSVNTTTSVTDEDTNCGKITSVGIPGMSFDFDAICEVSPSGSQASYKDCLTAITNSTKVKVRFQNPVVTGASTGAAYYHEVEAYFTDLTLNQETSAAINFSGTIQSTGTLDIIP